MSDDPVLSPLTDPSQWADLNVRVASGIAMAVVGIAAIILGGAWFQMLAVFVTAVMIWELWIMIQPERPTPGMLLAVLSGSLVSGMSGYGLWIAALIFLSVPVAGAYASTRANGSIALYGIGILLAGWQLIELRNDGGVLVLLWLVLVVVVTDIAGYFAGRKFGGPKFWPSISPKKTWSGTVAGWIGAGGIGLLFVVFTDAGAEIIPLSMALSLAGQMGDIAESALKRKQGIKDSSDLIPGHGGLLDRFDALLGATLFVLLLGAVTGGPGVQF